MNAILKYPGGKGHNRSDGLAPDRKAVDEF